ncbi:hypothetical protein CYMTET_55626 [Cymbomonas tetramitiformis]|uniref:Uncharacterized protein n=1 Tax=Cymbomonas tetramitiformis TaxID=36881 RepID=A0AAE0BD00_9CHLO|nr:hypothetical protein CYMTET_55626 [Cymbomonas tetramitiformis]
MGSYPTPYQQHLQQQQQWLAYQQQWPQQQQPLEPMQQLQQQQFQQQQLQQQQQQQRQQQQQQQQQPQPQQLVPTTSMLYDPAADPSLQPPFISIGAAILPVSQTPCKHPLMADSDRALRAGPHFWHIPSLSRSPEHSDPESGTDASRTSTGSRGSRGTLARAERRRRAARRSGSDSDASNRSEHIRREVLAAVQALNLSAVLSRELAPSGAAISAENPPSDDPQSSAQGALVADRPLEADAADSETPPESLTVAGAAPLEPPTQAPLNMMVARRRQSMESVVHGGGDPDSERRVPSPRSSPPSPPDDPPPDPSGDPDRGPGPSYPHYPEVRALFITHDGGSLWVHQSAGVRGAATVSLPRDERRRAGVQGDTILFTIMHLLGAPLTAYARMGGRLHHTPLLLTNPRVETWVLMVDREVMDMAMGDPAAANVRSTSMGQPVWEWIPATARESEMQHFDQDGLAAWSEVSNSDWPGTGATWS